MDIYKHARRTPRADISRTLGTAPSAVGRIAHRVGLNRRSQSEPASAANRSIFPHPGDLLRLRVVPAMGRIAALALTVIFAAAPVAGADEDSRVFAVFGGSMSTVTDDNGEDAFSVHYRKGLSGAVGFEHALTNLIGLQLRAGYNQNGADLTSGEVGMNAWWEFDYFEFSALTRLGNGLFHGLVGVSTGVAWGCSIKGQSQGFDRTTDCLRTESGNLSAVDFGLLAGIGTPEWNRIFANAIYSEGLRNVVNPGAPGRNRSLRVLIGIYFD